MEISNSLYIILDLISLSRISVFVWIFLILFIIILLFKFWYALHHGKCYSQARLDGKVAIVTGASAGIGKETALDFARRGARVIMACRNLGKAEKVADDIKKLTKNKKVEVQELDTSSLSSVRSFVREFIAKEKELHILVNNAGIGGSSRIAYTEDGFELTMATNHYGHFLLTNMLGGLLKASAPSRIIYVSSLMHMFARKLDPDDLNFKKSSYSSNRAYSQSKLCNVLIARELANRLTGTGVSAYSLHPGAVNTEIFFKNSLPLFNYLLGKLCALVGKSPEAGAQTTIYCAVDEEVATESGNYYSDCKKVSSSALGQNNNLAAKLWTASERDVKLQDDEANI